MNKKAILLVDDVELFLELEKSFLAREAFTLHTARSGKEALEKARSLRPDLILLDLYMPDMDGDAVCRTLKGTPALASLPVVMISSDSMAGTRERCYAAGCDAFVSKPLQREVLLASIEEALHISQRQHVRIPTRIECLVSSSSGERRTWIHCISEGGVFLEVGEGVAKGDRLRLTFTLSRGVPPVTTEAVVRWMGALSAQQKVKGAGMAFSPLDEAHLAAIRAYIESKRSFLQSLNRYS
jgi:uncharacterized protein (TIGR02266 family)